MKPFDLGTFETLQEARDGCIQSLNKQDEVTTACCLYIKWQSQDMTDFDMMIFDVAELDPTVIEPMDITEGDFAGN